MTGPQAPQPWWATTPGAAAGPDDADPVTRHRQARAGGPEEGDAAADAGSVPTWWGPAAEAVARLSEDLASTATANADAARGRASWEDEAPPVRDEPPVGHGSSGSRSGDGGQTAHTDDAGDAAADRDDAEAHLEVCGVCPICVGLRALGTHRPELVGHLAEAARHLAAAVRSVVETGTEPPRRPHAGAEDGLTRIDLDDLGGADDHPGEPGRG